jgi:hypothetical protein
MRVTADILEGAAKPVGGDAESTVRITDETNQRTVKRRKARG